MAAKRRTNKKRRRTSRSHSHRRRAVVRYAAAPVRRRRRARRANPSGRRRRRGNPSAGGLGSGVGNYLTFSLWAIAGMLGSRALPEAILGANNTGIMGYGANALTAIVGGPIVGKVMKNRRAGVAFTVGGILSLVARALQEYTPFGAQIKQAFALQGVGDPGMAGLGEWMTNNAFAQPMQMQNTEWPAQVGASTFVRAGLPAVAPLGAIYSGSSIWN